MHNGDDENMQTNIHVKVPLENIQKYGFVICCCKKMYPIMNVGILNGSLI